jgi:uncharacterized protein CbrC (UPF0167 family)
MDEQQKQTDYLELEKKYETLKEEFKDFQWASEQSTRMAISHERTMNILRNIY